MTRRWFRAWAVLAFLLTLAVTAPSAQTPAPVDEFVPLSSEDLAAEQEQIPAAALVFAAYGVVWLAFFVYLLSLWRRIAKVETELKAVTHKLERSVR